MKALIFFFSIILFNNQEGWLSDIEQAKKIATQKKEYILLNFSGSDWCGPCMRMKKEIFEADDFKTYAVDHLVLVNADFPRDKKNKLSKDQQRKNDKLADTYNADGKFPYTVLLTAEGLQVGAWEGLPDLTPKEFVQQIMSQVAKVSGK